jgi:hypothetical protein
MAKHNVRARIAQINGLVEETEHSRFTRPPSLVSTTSQIAKIHQAVPYEGENQ